MAEQSILMIFYIYDNIIAERRHDNPPSHHNGKARRFRLFLNTETNSLPLLDCTDYLIVVGRS
jgi:hypothetical protein